MKSVVIGICFAAILILLCLLLFKDSNILKRMKPGLGGSIKRWLKKPEKKKITKHPQIEISNRKREKYMVEVTNVPFYIGTSEFCDLKITDIDATDVHGVLELVRDEQGEVFVFKNLSKDHNSDYLEQPDNEDPYWVNLRENSWWRKLFNKSDRVELYHATEKFYLGETKLTFYMPSLDRKVTQTDRMNLYTLSNCEDERMDSNRRNASDRNYEDNGYKEDSVDC